MRVVWRAAAAALVVVMATQAGFAAPLFVNAGFETGDFTGWTVTVSGVGGPGDGTVTGLAGTGPENDDPQSITLSQVGVVSELVARLAVQWSAAVTEPANFDEHETAGYPFFGLRVENLTQGVVLLDVQHSSQELGGFWTLDGAQGAVNDPDNVYQPTLDPTTPGNWWYQDWTTES